jgi:hypothetical protein
VVPVVLGVAAVTMAGFYLNAVFAFAIVQPGRPQIRPAFTQARAHLPIVLGSGAVVGVLLGLSAVVVPRWGLFWFAVSLSIVVGIMMICSWPCRPAHRHEDRRFETRQADRHRGGRGRRRRDLRTALRAGPGRADPARVEHVLRPGRHPVRGRPYVAGRSDRAVKTVKMSAKLVSGRAPADDPALE